MKFTALAAIISTTRGLAVADNMVCNTLDGCEESASKCCYAIGTDDLGGLYDNLYCVPDGT